MYNEFKASFEDEENRRFNPFLDHVKKVIRIAKVLYAVE